MVLAGVTGAALSAVPCAAQRGGRFTDALTAGSLPTLDTSAVRVIASAIVFYADSDGVSRAARPPAKAWDIALPSAGDTTIWSALRTRLYGRVNGRPVAPADSAIEILRVTAGQTVDTLTFTINMGGRIRCGGAWRDGITTNQYRTIRSGGRWGPPMPIKASVVEPPTCR
jgi:hypothetical protein